MSWMSKTGRTIFAALRRVKTKFSSQWKLAELLGPYMPQVVCVDVGASYYPHRKWLVFLKAQRVNWLAVEPNEANIGYLKSWSWPCAVTACTTGLSQDGGVQTLYVTNVDSGSSLLPPEIPPSMQHRVTDRSYFFPVKERRIETLTLVQALFGMSETAPIIVKLDTQGTELSILKGAQALFDAGRIVGIEMESTLLAQPVMKGSGKFWQANEYLEAQGFELLHIKPIPAISQSGSKRPGGNTYLNECDSVFALRPDVVARKEVEYRVAMLGFYLTNQFYEEAASLLARDPEVGDYLKSQGCRVVDLSRKIDASL